MRIARWFNIYLCGVFAVCLCGCKTAEEKKLSKEASTMRFFLEASRGNPRSIEVPVYRSKPIQVRIQQEPVLDEGSILEAQVVEFAGSYAIQVQFNTHGRTVLDVVTGSNKGRRLVVHSKFTEDRWLAAPQITQRISNGYFTFAPDATREEADRIVRGLNNLILKIEKRNRF